MGKLQYRIICLIVLLWMVVNMDSSYGESYTAFAQEMTDSVKDEENEEKEDSDEKAPKITVSTIPKLDDSGDCIPLVTDTVLKYMVSADESCNAVLHIEKTTMTVSGGGVAALTEKVDQEISLTEDALEYLLVFEEEGEYTVYVTAEDDAGNETKTEKISFKMDQTAPLMSIAGVEDGAYYQNKRTIQFMVRDFTPDIEKTVVTVWKDGDNLELRELLWTDTAGTGYQYEAQLALEEEGNYRIVLEGTDRAGNRGESVTVSFWINWTAPVIKAECDTDYTVWSSRGIAFHTTVSDRKAGIKRIVYKANGKTLKKVTFDKPVYTYDYELTVSENADKVSGYLVTIEAVNSCGISSMLRRRVYIDKESPKLILSGVENGEHYNQDQFVTANVQDISYNSTEVLFIIRRTMDGMTETMYVPAFHPEQYRDICSRKMTKEGVYKIYAVATDGAGNVTKSNMLSFVIDKTAPELKLSGADADSMNNTPVTLEISCSESFFITNHVSIEVVRKLDRKTIKKELAGFPKTRKQSSMQYTFAEDGTYSITVSATDKAGNTAQTRSLTFSVDRTKPEIRIYGTGNYEQWDQPATLRFTVVESFYQDNVVVISGTRRNMYGSVTDVVLPKLRNTGKTSTLLQTFQEDGIYEFEVMSRDRAGNKNSRKIHFTIDQTAPRINGVKQFDGGCYEEFKLADTLDGIFEDLTVISYRMLLNGVEYNGTDTVTEEGKYNLYVAAEDELGHASSETIEFIIKHTAQDKIFAGVKNEEESSSKGAVNRNLDFVYNSEKTDVFKPGRMGLLLIPICLVFWVHRRKRKGKRENDDESNCI